jgi:PKD repeat protein
VYVFSPARATFDPQVTGCSFTVTFKNNTVDGTTYTWDFGDGTRSNQYNPPPHTYPRAGTYQVKLTVNSHSFCIDSLIIPVTVSDEPFADYDFQPDPCIPLARFFDRSTGGDTHLWDFGDGATSTDKNPIHTYAQPGTYDVRLIVNPGSNCTDTVIQTVTVEDNQTVAGKLSGSGTICLGDRSPVISLQDHIGNVVRWELSRDEGQTWFNLGKAGFTSYQTGPLTVTTWLRVVVQNGNCSVLTTEPAKIIVQRSPNAGILTADQTFACGEPAFPTLTLTNFNGTIESWEQSTDGEQSWTSINHTLSMYQPGAVTRNTAFRVWVRANTGTCRKGLSSVIRIEVEERTVGGTVSEHTTICLGQRSPLLTLNGQNGTVLKWQLSKTNGQTWVDLGKAGFTTYQPGSLTITTWFRAIVQKGTCAIAPSEPAIITVVREAMPGQITPSQTFCGSVENLTLTVTGIQARNYVWEKSENQQDWSVFASNIPTITLTTLSQTTSFRIKATNAFCSERYSQVSTFTVVTAPQVGVLSADATICLGQRSPLLTLNDHQGNILGWELSRDSMRTIVNLGKAGFDTYQPGGLTINTWIRVKVGNNFCEPVYSNWVKITVVRNAKGGIVTGGGTICYGSPAPLLNLVGHTGRIVRWQSSIDGQNWDNINQTTSFYQPTNLTRTTKYRVEVAGNIGSCGNVFSASAEIQVQNTSFSAGTLSADVLTLCPYGNAVLRLNGFSGIISHWEQSNDRINWQRINNNLSDYTDFRLTTNRFYRVWVRQPLCGTLQSSNIIAIQILPPTPGVRLNASKTLLCSGDNQVTFTLQNYVSGTITWQVSTDGNTFINLPETSATLSLNRLRSSTIVRAVIQNVCDAQQTESVTVEILPVLSLTKSFTVGCSGQASVELSATGGSGNGYSYELVGVRSNRIGTFTGIPTGNYQIKVTDANGCELLDSINITYHINPPQIISFERISDRSAWVVWSSDPLDNDLVYQVKYRPVGTADWKVIRNLTVTSIQLTSLEPATEYEVIIEIVCRTTPNQPAPTVVASSVPRNVRTLNIGTCQSEPPSVPTGLRVLQVTASQALVSWNPIPDMIINQQGYIISYGQENENPNNYTQLVICHADTHLWINNLRPNTSYRVRIRSNCTNCITALNITDRRSPWSSTVGFKTLAQRLDDPQTYFVNQIRIYPNPNNGRFTVFHPEIKATGYLSLFDISGRKILQQKLEEQHTQTLLDTYPLTEGVYLLAIIIDDTIYRQKVVVEQ